MMTEELTKRISDDLRAIRRRKYMTMNWVADEAGLGRSTVVRVENWEHDTLLRLFLSHAFVVAGSELDKLMWAFEYSINSSNEMFVENLMKIKKNVNARCLIRRGDKLVDTIVKDMKAFRRINLIYTVRDLRRCSGMNEATIARFEQKNGSVRLSTFLNYMNSVNTVRTELALVGFEYISEIITEDAFNKEVKRIMKEGN